MQTQFLEGFCAKKKGLKEFLNVDLKNHPVDAMTIVEKQINRNLNRPNQ